MCKSAALLFLLILTVSSLMMAKPASASIPKPSIPEFTVKLIDSSYDVPTTTTTDPYTGQQVTHPSSHVESRTLEVIITNVPFTSFIVNDGSNNWTANFYYNIRYKGHFEQNWHELYIPIDSYLPRSSGSKTIFSAKGEYSLTEGLKMDSDTKVQIRTTFPPDAQIDFQVEAMVGHTHGVYASSGAVFEGETSDWSNTQTLTISDNSTPTNSGTSATPNPSVLPSQNPTATSSQPGAGSPVLFGWGWAEIVIVVLLAVIAALLIFVVVFLRRRSVR